METVNQLNCLYTKSMKNTFTTEDFNILRSAILKKQIPSQLIKKYNEQDSTNLLITLIKSTAIKILLNISFIENFAKKIDDEILNELYEYLFQELNFISPDCYIEYSKHKKETNFNILKLFNKVNEPSLQSKLCFYLQNKEDLDYIGINFALLNSKFTNIKNKDLKCFNTKKLDGIFYKLLHKYREDITFDNKKEIFYLCKEKLIQNRSIICIENEESKKYLFYMAIISLINQDIKEKDFKLFNTIPDEANDVYLGFIDSLMVDNESTLCGWNVLLENRFIENIIYKLKNLFTMLHTDMEIENIEFLNISLILFQKIVKNLKESHLVFIRNIDAFINILWTDLPNKFIGNLSKFLSFLMYDDEVKNKIFDYFTNTEIFKRKKNLENEYFLFNKKSIYEVFEKEFNKKNYDLTSGFVILFSQFLKYDLFEKEINEFYNCAIKSYDTNILKTILKTTNVKYLTGNDEIIKGISKGIEKDDNLCFIFLEFILKHLEKKNDENDLLGFISKDFGLMQNIVRSKCNLFFKFISTFDFNLVSLFLNDDFLERINENLEKALIYLVNACKHNEDFCKFIIRHKDNFNNILEFDLKKLELYSVLSENHIESLSLSKNDNFLVVPEIQNNEYFNILSNLIVYNFKEGKNIKNLKIKNYEYRDENLENYCKYLKTLICIEEIVEKEILDLLKFECESEFIAELIGFYKSIKKDFYLSYQFESKNLRNRILNNFNMTNNELFFKNFKKCSSFDKFLLFFILDKKNICKEISIILLDELKNLLKENNFNGQNDLLLKQCLNALLHTKNVDEAIKLLKGVTLPESYNDLLMKLCLKNLILRGKEILEIKILEKANLDLQCKCIFLLWTLKVIRASEIRIWVDELRKKIVDEDLEKIRKELQIEMVY